ncbi:MAG: efflux RND transporter periplasmic adaptor subunit [Verrucomicrobiota bacterium]
MKIETLKAPIQIILVVFFILGALIASRLMKSEYAPGARNAGEERAFFASFQTVENAPFQIELQTTGTIVALAEVDIVPEVSGRLVSISPTFLKGGSFAADKTLFQIDPRDFELEVRNRRAEVAGARTSLELESAEASAALAEWSDRNGNLPAPDLVARRPQIAEAEAALEAASARLGTAELSLLRTRFQLPDEGRVLESNLTEGQFLQAGVSYGRVFYSGQLEVETSLKSNDLKWLFSEPKTKVKISADYLGETLEYEGMLERGIAAIESQTRFATVRFGFSNPPEELLPGLFANVTIFGPSLSNVAKLPLSVLQPDGSLARLNEDNRMQRVEPEIVFRGNDYIVVADLKDGDRILTSRLDGVSEGVLIKPVAGTDGERSQ